MVASGMCSCVNNKYSRQAFVCHVSAEEHFHILLPDIIDSYVQSTPDCPLISYIIFIHI